MKIRQNTKSITASILVLMGLALVTVMPNAYATVDCNHWLYGKCYADQTFSNTGLTGNKYAIKVTNLQTSSCNHTQHATVTGWTLFPNGDFLEAGVSQGILDGTCYNNENRYLGWKQGSNNPLEARISSATIGTTQTFETSNTNGDTRWEIYNNSLQYGSFIMQTSTASSVRVGEEATNSQTSIPSTHIGSIQKRLSSWSDWSSATVHEESEQSTWLKHDCTPNYAHIHVGIEGTENCTD